MVALTDAGADGAWLVVGLSRKICIIIYIYTHIQLIYVKSIYSYIYI